MTRRATRLGVIDVTGSRYGEMEHPDPGAPPGRWAARWIFCEVLREEAPSVLRELHEAAGHHLKDLLRRVAASGDDPYLYALKWSSVGDVDDRLQLAEKAKPSRDRKWLVDRLTSEVSLRDAILAWGIRYNLADPWMFDVALRSLHRWVRVPAFYEFQVSSQGVWTPNWALEAFGSRGVVPETSDPPGIWVPFAETRGDYEERVRGYIESVATAYREAGWTAAPEKRTPVSTDGERRVGPGLHFRWVVRIQVLRWTNRRIAEVAGVYIRSIRRAYKETCSLLGLTPLARRRPRA